MFCISFCTVLFYVYRSTLKINTLITFTIVQRILISYYLLLDQMKTQWMKVMFVIQSWWNKWNVGVIERIQITGDRYEGMKEGKFHRELKLMTTLLGTNQRNIYIRLHELWYFKTFLKYYIWFQWNYHSWSANELTYIKPIDI